MNKTKLITLAAALMSLVTLNTGCSHTKQIGRIGFLEIHKVSLRGLDGPNITALATRNVIDNEVRFVESANGPGIGPAIIGAAGNAGGAALNGISLRPATTRINNNTASQGGFGAGGSATGGGGGNGGAGYGSAGATSSSNTQSSSYSQSDSWSGVIGSGNAVQAVCVHGGNCGVCRR